GHDVPKSDVPKSDVPHVDAISDSHITPDSHSDVRPDVGHDAQPDIVRTDASDMGPDLPVTINDCTNPIDANATQNTDNHALVVAGDTSGPNAADNTSGTCAGGSGPKELVYKYHTPDAPGMYRVVASTNTDGTMFDTVVYARSTCTDRFAQLACDDDSGRDGK